MKRYGDAVILVQKQSDGTLRRLNAIVLASSLHVPTTADRKPIKDEAGDPLPHAEHLDVAFPVPTLVPDGGVLKTRNMDEIFRPAYDVAPWGGDGWIGYEPDAEPEPGPEESGSSSEKYGDGDFAQPGDPYGIAAEYGAQSFVPSAEDATAAEDTHKEEIADAENNHGQGDEHQD